MIRNIIPSKLKVTFSPRIPKSTLTANHTLYLPALAFSFLCRESSSKTTIKMVPVSPSGNHKKARSQTQGDQKISFNPILLYRSPLISYFLVSWRMSRGNHMLRELMKHFNPPQELAESTQSSLQTIPDKDGRTAGSEKTEEERNVIQLRKKQKNTLIRLTSCLPSVSTAHIYKLFGVFPT